MSDPRKKISALSAWLKNALRDREKLIDWGKTALIAVLTLSAVLLSTRSGLFERTDGAGEKDASLSAELITDAATGYAPAAEPFCIVVTQETGSHYAAQYDGAELDDVYAKFSAVLGEALGSSGEPGAVAMEQWEQALRGGGVYFDFHSDQPLAVLAGWLGTTISAGAASHTARRICLAREEDKVVLYYLRARESGGTAYKCATALGWSALSGRVGEYLPNNVCYNFEQEQPFELVDRYAVLSYRQPTPPSLSARVPERTEAEDGELLTALGMSSYLAVPYAESDGTAVYVDGDSELRIAPTGVVTFTRTGDHGAEEESMSAARMIETVRSMLQSTLGARSGDAEIYLSYIALDTETGLYTLRFEYRVNGLTVSLGAGLSAANVIMRGSVIMEAKMVFREYHEGDAAEKPLPPLQAFAIVQAEGGGEPRLTYLDDLESVRASWIIA